MKQETKSLQIRACKTIIPQASIYVDGDEDVNDVKSTLVEHNHNQSIKE